MSKTNKILIVDDEPIGRQLLEAILFTENYDLNFATNGKEAYEHAIHNNPDLILMDVMMPEMDGFEVTKKIRTNNELKNVPIILITALDDRDSKIRGLDAGADDYISKPFDRVEVLAKVKNIISLERYRTTEAVEEKTENKDPELLSSVLSTLVPDDKFIKKIFSDYFFYRNANKNIFCISKTNNITISVAIGPTGNNLNMQSFLLLLNLINLIIHCEDEINVQILIEKLKDKIKIINDSGKNEILQISSFYLSVCLINDDLNTIESAGINSDIFFILKNKIQKINAQDIQSKTTTVTTEIEKGDSIFILSSAIMNITKTVDTSQEDLEKLLFEIDKNPGNGHDLINNFIENHPESKKYKENSSVLYLKI